MGEPAQPAKASTYLVEHYWPGATADLFRSTSERVRTTAEAMRRGGTPIRYLHAILVPADEAAFCLIDAGSQELVEQLYARAGIGFDRIVAALEA